MASPARLEAADRVNILMALVPYLIDNSPVSIDSLATMFQLDPSQVREIVALLAVSGVPGDSGAYQHQDLFDINWDAFENDDVVELWNHVALEETPRFSAREAATLVAGLNYLAGIVDPSAQPALSTLLSKIGRGSSSQPQNIVIDAAPPLMPVGLIREGISSSRCISFTYTNLEAERSVRIVSPLRLDAVGRVLYLRAWCHDREALRTFRCERIADAHFVDVTFSEDALGAVIEDELFVPHDTDISAVIRVSEDQVGQLAEYSPEPISTSAGFVNVRISFAEMANLLMFVARFAGRVEVLEPEAARMAVHAWATKLSSRIDELTAAHTKP